MSYLNEILQNGDAWHSVFCSVFTSMEKEKKAFFAEKFRKIIEETIPNNDFNDDTRKKYLEAYKKAYYYATGKTYKPEEI